MLHHSWKEQAIFSYRHHGTQAIEVWAVPSTISENQIWNSTKTTLTKYSSLTKTQSKLAPNLRQNLHPSDWRNFGNSRILQCDDVGSQGLTKFYNGLISRPALHPLSPWGQSYSPAEIDEKIVPIISFFSSISASKSSLAKPPSSSMSTSILTFLGITSFQRSMMLTSRHRTRSVSIWQPVTMKEVIRTMQQVATPQRFVPRDINFLSVKVLIDESILLNFITNFQIKRSPICLDTESQLRNILIVLGRLDFFDQAQQITDRFWHTLSKMFATVFNFHSNNNLQIYLVGCIS